MYSEGIRGLFVTSELAGTRICSFSNRFTQYNRAQLLQQTLQSEPSNSLPRVTPCPSHHVTQLWLPHLPGSGAEEDGPRGAQAMSADSAGLTALIWDHSGETQSLLHWNEKQTSSDCLQAASWHGNHRAWSLTAN